MKHKLWGKLKKQAHDRFTLAVNEEGEYVIGEHRDMFFRECYNCKEGSYTWHSETEAAAFLTQKRDEYFYKICNQALYYKRNMKLRKKY